MPFCFDRNKKPSRTTGKRVFRNPQESRNASGVGSRYFSALCTKHTNGSMTKITSTKSKCSFASAYWSLITANSLQPAVEFLRCDLPADKFPDHRVSVVRLNIANGAFFVPDIRFFFVGQPAG